MGSYDKGSNPMERQVEKHILKVLPYHCADHSGCKEVDKCGFLCSKTEKGFQINFTLSNAQYDEVCEHLFEKKYCRFKQYLQLNKQGLLRALREFTRRYNKQSIPALTRKCTTSQVESL
jgi:hypothetical protein